MLSRSFVRSRLTWFNSTLLVFRFSLSVFSSSLADSSSSCAVSSSSFPACASSLAALSSSSGSGLVVNDQLQILSGSSGVPGAAGRSPCCRSWRASAPLPGQRPAQRSSNRTRKQRFLDEDELSSGITLTATATNWPPLSIRKPSSSAMVFGLPGGFDCLAQAGNQTLARHLQEILRRPAGRKL